MIIQGGAGSKKRSTKSKAKATKAKTPKAKPTKAQLYEKAKKMKVEGRSKMSYAQLQRVTTKK